MFPLRDINPVRTMPVLTWTLVFVNVSLWLFQYWLYLAGGGDRFATFIFQWGVVPARLLELDGLITPVSSMFLHGDWLHLAGNMWFLWVFGDNVEDRMGKLRFAVFYLACGFAAVVAQVLIDPSSTVPMVGASGAIAGVLAAYVVLHPMARVITFIPLFFLVEVPAFVFVFVWFGFQLLSGTEALGAIGQNQGGVAFFAHIGGFLAGLILVFVIRGPPRPDVPTVEWRRRSPRSEPRFRQPPRPGEWGQDRHRPE